VFLLYQKVITKRKNTRYYIINIFIAQLTIQNLNIEKITLNTLKKYQRMPFQLNDFKFDSSSVI